MGRNELPGPLGVVGRESGFGLVVVNRVLVLRSVINAVQYTLGGIAVIRQTSEGANYQPSGGTNGLIAFTYKPKYEGRLSGAEQFRGRWAFRCSSLCPCS